MAGTEVYLDVPFHKQETPYYCGPAVAKMFLDWFGVTESQDDLWEAIKSNTDGSLPPDVVSDHSWDEQVCDNCGTDRAPDWQCWDTTPEALQKTVADETALTLGADYPSTFEPGVVLLIESLDRATAVPPFATITGINHWVLVIGYRRDDPDLPSEPVGEYKLNGLYYLDPQQEDTAERVKFVTTEAWKGLFGLILCGPHIDTRPVVVGEDRFPRWVPAAAVAAGALILVIAWWWL